MAEANSSSSSSPSSAASSWWRQFAALTYKSWKVLWHRKTSLATFVLAPSLAVIILYILFATVGLNSKPPPEDDLLVHVPTSLAPCIALDRSHHELPLGSFSPPNSTQTLHRCITLGFVPDASARARGVMQEVASSVDLRYGSDVLEFSSVESLSDFMFENPGHVDLGVVFGPGDLLSYEIWFNESYTGYSAGEAYGKQDSMLRSHGVSGRLLALQKSLDAALIRAQAQDPNLALEYRLRLGAFTDIKNKKASLKAEAGASVGDENDGCVEPKVRNQNVIGIVGSALIATGVGISSIVVLLTVVSEKQNKLTGKLRQMGLMESAHILSWTCVFFVLGFISSLLATIIMKLIGLSHDLLLFKQSSFGVLFITLFLFLMAMIGAALIISSLFSRPAFIMTISSMLFLGILFSSLWMSASSAFDLYESDDSGKCFRASNAYSSTWLPHKPSHFYEFLIFWFPWISYGRIMSEMFAATKHLKTFSFQDLATRTHYIAGGSKVYSAPALSQSLGFMLGLFIVSLPLVWYFSQALAGRTNGRRRWHFPFQAGYWGFVTSASGYTKGDTFAEEREKSQREGSLRVHKLSKSYKGGTALREVSLTMQHGEVFALLGHNGAGKTTLINVLTGLTDATYGEAYFSGYSFKDDMAQIQSVCGICPQFDALWDELNAEDHLYVCAAMQGLHGKSATEEITRVLEAVDLLEERKSKTTTFSGGMKRRLSVCMAVLGDRKKLIFLDEPTTGVDTMNKKRVWQLIEKLKQDKIVVLTTHNMEEADALGDKIAILHQGSLKAAGSSLFLKKEFGSGYQVSMLLTSAEDAPEVESIVKRVIPGAKIVQSAAGNLRVSLNHNSALAIPKLLAELKASLPGSETTSSSTSSMLKEWGISNTTLEEVFLRLSAQSELQVTEESGKSDTENLCLICGVKKAEAVTLYTHSGIAVKVPNAICLACAVSETGAASDEVKSVEVLDAAPEVAADAKKGDSPSSPKLNDSAVINIQADAHAQQEPRPSPKSRARVFLSQLRAMFYKNFILNLAEKKSFIFYLVLLLVYVLLIKFFGGSFVARKNSPIGSDTLCPGRSDLLDRGYCSAQQFRDGLSDPKLSWDEFIPQVLVSDASSSSRVNGTPVVWFSTKGSFPLRFPNQAPVQMKQVQADDLNSVFVSSQESLQKNATPADQIPFSPCSGRRNARGELLYIGDLSTANATFDSLFPSSGVAWSVDSSRAGSLVKVFSTLRFKTMSHNYDAETIWIKIPSMSSGSCYYYPGGSSFKNLVPFSNTNSQSRMSPAPALAINAISNSVLQALSPSPAVIRTSLRTYPSLSFVSGSGQGSAPPTTFALMFAITGMSLFFSTFVRRLVMERETGLMRMMAIAGMRPAAYWLGSYLYDFTLSVLQAAIFFIIGRVVGSSFTKADPILTTIIILVWAHSLNSMATLTSGSFRSPRAASLFAVIAMTASAAGCTFVNFKYKTSSSMPLGAAVFPPLALARILFLLFTDSRTHELGADLIVLLFASTVLYIIGLFINLARASTSSFKMLPCSKSNSESGVPIDEKPVDADDLLQEAEKVRSSPPGALAIKTENLRKVFPTRSGKAVKIAVDDLTLGLEYGEIFGLLGANGAGKTTALSMLSGSLAPSSGVIQIGGKPPGNVLENQLSICPQTDVVWKDLSVWTHFMFYAYLKGLSSAEARASIQSIAADLSLSGDSFHKKASKLSGGQLRRLSFGVSLVGSPSILLMDEMTTGLDPASRTTIWEVVKKQSNAGRLILLTTHSMEEADTLCTRIGIMSHGQMKCLGAPLNLKNRYSNGYTLTIVSESVSEETEGASVLSLVQRAAPDATLIYTWRRVRKYSIKSFDLQHLFQLLEDDSNKYRYGIREWQIEQTTLQDVFLKVSE